MECNKLEEGVHELVEGLVVHDGKIGKTNNKSKRKIVVGLVITFALIAGIELVMSVTSDVVKCFSDLNVTNIMLDNYGNL